jgi:hypothetical protein
MENSYPRSRMTHRRINMDDGIKMTDGYNLQTEKNAKKASRNRKLLPTPTMEQGWRVE